LIGTCTTTNAKSNEHVLRPRLPTPRARRAPKRLIEGERWQMGSVVVEWAPPSPAATPCPFRGAAMELTHLHQQLGVCICIPGCWCWRCICSRSACGTWFEALFFHTGRRHVSSRSWRFDVLVRGLGPPLLYLVVPLLVRSNSPQTSHYPQLRPLFETLELGCFAPNAPLT
jgi:hypothetical protein